MTVFKRNLFVLFLFCFVVGDSFYVCSLINIYNVSYGVRGVGYFCDHISRNALENTPFYRSSEDVSV